MEQLEFAFEYSEQPRNDLLEFLETSLKEIDKAFESFSPKVFFEQLELSL